MSDNTKRFMRVPEAAEYMRVAASTLAKMRSRGDGPKYLKAGARIVLYDRAELDSYLAVRSRQSTSQRVIQGCKTV